MFPEIFVGFLLTLLAIAFGLNVWACFTADQED